MKMKKRMHSTFSWCAVSIILIFDSMMTGFNVLAVIIEPMKPASLERKFIFAKAAIPIWTLTKYFASVKINVVE